MEYAFKNVKVLEKAHLFVKEVYKVTKNYPVTETYGLTSQIRRSAVSVATNIAEGYKRKSRKDFLHFLNLSDSSLEETKYHLFLSRDLGYLKEEEYKEISIIADEVGRMLAGFQRSVNFTFRT